MQSLSFNDARRLVDEAEALLYRIDERLYRSEPDYDDRLEHLSELASNRVYRRRKLLALSADQRSVF